MVYHFRIHRNNDGFWAECVELTGCRTQGATRAELAQNAQEALNLYLDEPPDSPLAFPLPHEPSRKGVLEVAVEPRLALSVLLRNYRLQRGMTQRELAVKLAMKNAYSYQRLERRANPTLEMLGRLKAVFPDLSVDYVLSDVEAR